MINRLRRLAARFLAIGLVAATLFTVDSLASPSPAEARCGGVNNPLWSYIAWDGYAASDSPGAGTCNGNQIYTGVLKDVQIDGYCVQVWIRDGNEPWTNYFDRVCGYGNEVTFQYHDINGNSRFYEKFCLVAQTPGVFPERVCGWGTAVGYSIVDSPYGINYGF